MRRSQDIEAVDDLDAAKLYLERFGERIKLYATVPGKKTGNDESHEYQASEMAEAKKDLDKFERKAFEKDRKMAMYKVKYVSKLG